MEYYQDWEVKQWAERTKHLKGRCKPHEVGFTRLASGSIDCKWVLSYQSGTMCRYEGCSSRFHKAEDVAMHEIYEHDVEEKLKGYFRKN